MIGPSYDTEEVEFDAPQFNSALVVYKTHKVCLSELVIVQTDACTMSFLPLPCLSFYFRNRIGQWFALENYIEETVDKQLDRQLPFGQL